jgi:hypothetical protein
MSFSITLGASPSQSFIFTGAGAPLPPGVRGKVVAKSGQVTFEPGPRDKKGSSDSGGVRYVVFIFFLID